MNITGGWAAGNVTGYVFQTTTGLAMAGVVAGSISAYGGNGTGISITADCNDYVLSGVKTRGNSGAGFVDAGGPNKNVAAANNLFT